MRLTLTCLDFWHVCHRDVKATPSVALVSTGSFVRALGYGLSPTHAYAYAARDLVRSLYAYVAVR